MEAQTTNQIDLDAQTEAAIADSVKRVVSRLRRHVKDMDAGIRIKRMAIKEATAAADQLEADKIILDNLLDEIEQQQAANVQAHRHGGEPAPSAQGACESKKTGQSDTAGAVFGAAPCSPLFTEVSAISSQSASQSHASFQKQ